MESIEADPTRIRLALQPTVERLKRPFHEVVYGGFASELSFNGTTTTCILGDEYNPGSGDFTWQWRCKFPADTAARTFLTKRASLATAGDAGYSAWVNASEAVKFSISDGTNSYTNDIGLAGDYDDDTRRTFTVVLDRTLDEVRSYVDETLKDTTDISVGLGNVLNTLNLEFGRISGGGSPYDSELDEVRFWSRHEALERMIVVSLDLSQGQRSGPEAHLV